MSYQDFYQSREWLELRYDVFRRHGRICMVCRSDEKRLHVDHIKPRSLHPELELDINNLQVLCESCNLGKSNRDDSDFRETCMTNARFNILDAFLLLVYNLDFLSLEDDIDRIRAVPADSQDWGTMEELDGRSMWTGALELLLKKPYQFINCVNVCIDSKRLDDGRMLAVFLADDILDKELLLFDTDLKKDPVKFIEFFLHIIRYKSFHGHVDRVLYCGKKMIKEFKNKS